jgi:hypothetical protein
MLRRAARGQGDRVMLRAAAKSVCIIDAILVALSAGMA